MNKFLLMSLLILAVNMNRQIVAVDDMDIDNLEIAFGTLALVVPQQIPQRELNKQFDIQRYQISAAFAEVIAYCKDVYGSQRSSEHEIRHAIMLLEQEVNKFGEQKPEFLYSDVQNHNLRHLQTYCSIQFEELQKRLVGHQLNNGPVLMPRRALFQEPWGFYPGENDGIIVGIGDEIQPWG